MPDPSETYNAYTVWRRPKILLSPAQVAYVRHFAAQLGIGFDEAIGGLLIVAIDQAMQRADEAGQRDWRAYQSRADLTGVQR